MKKVNVPGFLLLYSHPILKDAPTIMEHIQSFPQYSKFKIRTLNVDYGWPLGIDALNFDAVILHYSLWSLDGFAGESRFLDYLQSTKSYKIAFFQDEYHHCRRRVNYINDLGINSIYTLLNPAYWDEVYGKHTKVTDIHHTLTGYVSQALTEKARQFFKSENQREIDVGYRARNLPFYMGKGAQEKAKIAEEFAARTREAGLRLDFNTDLSSRLYGEDWYKFLANCKTMIGVEAGVSIFDLNDEVRIKCEQYLAEHPKAPFEEVYKTILKPHEDRIFYRTISPRHFEAAAFRVLQVLFEGQYNHILKPNIHYIPLKKDFSNLNEVLGFLKDDSAKEAMREKAYSDLIASQKYSYKNFIAGFDDHLLSAGFIPQPSRSHESSIRMMLASYTPMRVIRQSYQFLKYRAYPGKSWVKFLSRSLRPCKIKLEKMLFSKR